ncbi:MAG: 3-keto-5-aminohexanoate cleavage protein [Deltaproteobacteria bacterium]|nr:3-keto-5-aminohexanoate cleavage protein [Deltaproteobacteria bacterium]
MEKFILNCAVTGAIHTPTMAPYLPIRPEDIADQAIAAANAGASTVHVHARDPETGIPTPDTNVMGEIVSRIHANSDVVICITTGGGMNMTVDERIAAVPIFKPELASCNLGSMNFALFPVVERFDQWDHEWEPAYLEGSRDFIFRNTFGDLEKIMGVFRASGTKPEFEAYDIGHLHNARHFYEKGEIASPFYVQFVTGILGGIASTIPHLVYMKQTADGLFGTDLAFSTIGAGRNEFPLATTSILLGGGARVGLEDNLRLSAGKMAKSNAELVEKMVRIAAEFGYEPYSPDETRAVLGLSGRAGVSM